MEKMIRSYKVYQQVLKLDGKIEESRNAINLIQKIKTLSAQKQKIKKQI